MRMGARHLLSSALAALLALSVAMAARPHEAPSRAGLALSALALAYGTAPELCAAGDDDGVPDDRSARCSLCLLAKAAVLGPSPGAAGRVLASSRAAAPLAPRVVHAAAWPPAPPARGPPPASLA